MDEQSRKQHLRLWIVIAAMGLVPILLFGLHVISNRNGVQRRLKALRTAGYPTNLTEWAERHKLLNGTPNAAEIYEQAFNQYVYPSNDANVPVVGQAALPDRGLLWSEPMLSAVAQCLQDNQACLDSLHKAAGIDQCWYNWGSVLNTSELSGFRHCVFLLRLEALLYIQQGRRAPLIPCLASLLSLGDSLRREPSMIPYMMRISAVAISIDVLERMLGMASFTDQELCELDRMFIDASVKLDFTEAIVSERCEMIEVFQDRSRLNNYINSQGTFLGVPGVMTTGLIDMLDYMADLSEATKLPPTERLVRFKAIDAEKGDLPFWHFIIKRGGIASLGRIGELDVRIHVHIRLAQIALAIERYRLATGHVPEQLEVLVPKYLDAVPIDPFDGQPIRYRPSESGYCLYSVNDDGQDNGGKERDKINRNAPYDLCFIVTR